MTTLEYNEEFYPKYSGAVCMLGSIENTLAKCKDPEDVRYQFSCSGWSKESITFLKEAVEAYKNETVRKAIKETVGRELIC